VTDLHSVLLEAITARKARAEVSAAPGSGSWRAFGGWLAVEVGRCTCAGGGEWPHERHCGYEPMVEVPLQDAEFMAGEDPAAVQRQCAEDLDVLTRHYVCADLNCGGEGGDCHTCRDEFHPCPEILSVARRYGLGVEAEGNQP